MELVFEFGFRISAKLYKLTETLRQYKYLKTIFSIHKAFFRRFERYKPNDILVSDIQYILWMIYILNLITEEFLIYINAEL